MWLAYGRAWTCADGRGRCADGRGRAQGVHAQAGTRADERAQLAGRRQQAARGRARAGARGRQARGAWQARGAQSAGRPGRSLCAQAGPAGPGWGFVHSDSVFLARFDSVVS